MVISYGQNFEDVILARALSDITIGKYVDVGAHDPEIDSVTNHFYQIGWSGINIEPQKSLHEKLTNFRPRDTNLNLCIGDFDGLTDFAEVQNRTGWSTSSEDQIKNLATDAELTIKIEVIEQKTLFSVLNEFSKSDIHFLKVDVEGNELNVVKGLNLKVHRPWIMVIEATKPGSLEPNFQEWEPLVVNNGYVFVYADGLNRFYLAEEHIELLPRFGSPPNVLDDFESQHTFFAKSERDRAFAERDHSAAERNRLSIVITEMSSQISNQNDHIASQEWEISQLLLERDSLRSKLFEFKDSISWKATKPLRFVARVIKFR